MIVISITLQTSKFLILCCLYLITKIYIIQSLGSIQARDSILHLPEMQTLTSVLITMEAVIMTASTPQVVTYASVIKGMSCRGKLEYARVSTLL